MFILCVTYVIQIGEKVLYVYNILPIQSRHAFFTCCACSKKFLVISLGVYVFGSQFIDDILSSHFCTIKKIELLAFAKVFMSVRIFPIGASGQLVGPTTWTELGGFELFQFFIGHKFLMLRVSYNCQVVATLMPALQESRKVTLDQGMFFLSLCVNNIGGPRLHENIVALSTKLCFTSALWLLLFIHVDFVHGFFYPSSWLLNFSVLHSLTMLLLTRFYSKLSSRLLLNFGQLLKWGQLFGTPLLSNVVSSPLWLLLKGFSEAWLVRNCKPHVVVL